jgi:hypothetical protein
MVSAGVERLALECNRLYGAVPSGDQFSAQDLFTEQVLLMVKVPPLFTSSHEKCQVIHFICALASSHV